MIKPTIFLGPPGTGKTTTLLDTVDQELESGVPPEKIGFLTFTNRGVDEAIERAKNRFGFSKPHLRYFNTLHAMAFRHLGLNPKQVFTGFHINEFARAHGLHMSQNDGPFDDSLTGLQEDDLVLFLENLARIKCIPVERLFQDYSYRIDPEHAMMVTKLFRQYKMKEGMYDFTDMLEEFIKLNDPPRLDVLIVDEAQDLSELQWLMVSQLSRYVKRVYCAGDDDQTIFTWAGASKRFITMEGDVKVLGQSYRVPRAVFKVANRVINSVLSRRQKQWNPRDADGSNSMLQGISQLDPEVVDSRNGTVMMLGRTTKILKRKFLPYCREHGLPYRYFRNSSIRPAHAAGIDAWIRLCHGESVSADAIFRAYDLMISEEFVADPGYKRGSRSQMLALSSQPDPPSFNIRELRESYGLLANENMPWPVVLKKLVKFDLDYIKKVIDHGHDIMAPPTIQISTIHRVKGGQADTVILASDTVKETHRTQSDPDDEARVFYTGITRSFRDLIVVEPDRKHYYERLFE